MKGQRRVFFKMKENIACLYNDSYDAIKTEN